MFNSIEVKAAFSNLNVKAGKTVLQFELNADSVSAIPMLARMTGSPVRLTVETDQEVLFVNDGTGEVSDQPLFGGDGEDEQESAAGAEDGEPEGE